MFEFLTPSVQNLLAVALVALAATWLVVRSVRRKKARACGCSGCPSNAAKADAATSDDPNFIPLDSLK